MASNSGGAAQFETEAALDGVSDSEIHLSRLTGMSPHDIEHLRIFTINEALLIVIRCPKRNARYWHGKIQPKTLATSLKGLKSDEDGLVHLPDGRKQVSDYDLMCVYRVAGYKKYEKIFFSGVDPKNKKSHLADEARLLIKKLNSEIKSPFQHGAQDDYHSKDNPGVKYNSRGVRGDHYVAFILGVVKYMPTTELAESWYRENGLTWPYVRKNADDAKAVFDESLVNQ